MLHGFCQLADIVRVKACPILATVAVFGDSVECGHWALQILSIMLFVICFQRQLADAFLELGEMDQALDDVLGLLHETEAELLDSDSVSGDPNYCEVFAAKVQVLDSIFSHYWILQACWSCLVCAVGL